MSHEIGPPWTTWQRGLETIEARRRDHRSLASSRSRAQKLVREGRARRMEGSEVGTVLTRYRDAVR
jgi:hypothetical protein